MILRLTLPQLAAAVTHGVVAAWHKEIGDRISFGDDICDVDVGEIARMRRRLTAHASSRERRAGRTKFRTRSDVLIRYRITSAEDCTLTEVKAPVGKQVRTGDTLAMMESGGGAAAPGSQVVGARVVVNLVRGEGS